MKTELERIALLARIFGVLESDMGVGIGDDAAVLERPGERLVWTVDAQVEGTHFRREWLSWHDVGWRSFMAAASDLAAMGATPIATLSALALPPDVDDAALASLAEGQAEAARAIGARVVGGNLARAGETSITTTLLGHAARPILRRGARPGDAIWLAGEIGRASAGLAALERAASAEDPDIAACIQAWRRPRALIAEGLRAAAVATAGIDISDGLARDAAHVAEASGVTLAFDAGVALHGGGEDYALLMTSPVPIEGFRRVGVVQERGAAALLSNGNPVEPTGFDHFTAS